MAPLFGYASRNTARWEAGGCHSCERGGGEWGEWERRRRRVREGEGGMRDGRPEAATPVGG